jgi:hypothetical protein
VFYMVLHIVANFICTDTYNAAIMCIFNTTRNEQFCIILFKSTLSLRPLFFLLEFIKTHDVKLWAVGPVGFPMQLHFSLVILS